MKVTIKFSNGHQQQLQLAVESTVGDALEYLASSFGVSDALGFAKEWGLTVPHEGPQWINNHWFDLNTSLVEALSSSQTLLFGKKIFTKSDELNLMTIPPVLADILFHQLLSTYLSGAFYCPAYKSAKLSSLAAYIEFATTPYLTSGTQWLLTYLPPRLQHYPSLPQLIDKNMKNIGQRSPAVVKTAFIKGLMKLDTFGLTLFSSKVNSECGVLGINYRSLFWMDSFTFEPIEHWPINTIEQLVLTPSSEIKITFTGQQEVLLDSAHFSDISRLLADFTQLEIKRPESYTLQTGSDDESHIEVEVVPVRQLAHKTSTGSAIADDSNSAPKSISPFSRRGERRKAFRRKTEQNLLNSQDSVEVLSELMGTDFESCQPAWTTENGSSPVYDSVASTRVDTTLRLSNLTYPALSQTLRWNRGAPPTNVAGVSEERPPLLPPKRSRFVSIAKEDSVEDESDYAQRLGTYVLNAPAAPPPADYGQRSRIVQPNEALKDYATLRREFRMFCIKLPNGILHWELASLYQPIHKLISRLCILIHAASFDGYELFLEGSILSRIKESQPLLQDGSDDHQTSSSRDFTPSPSNGLESLASLKPMPKKNIILPNQGMEPILLDPRLTFKDHNISTSRLLSLRPKLTQTPERLPRMVIRIPDWVKFHQCWLGIVHGNQPCTISEAITLAAILYQCYVMDRSEANSVISFCNVLDFLPPEYATVRGIEEKILKERQHFLNYSREQLQQIYITGVCTSPFHQTVFFPCKEPRRQFLSNFKMVPIYLGVNSQGIMRVEAKSRQILDIWTHELFRNWGYSKNSFLLEFGTSTYPVKTNQGRWITELINFHVSSILQLKVISEEDVTPVVNGEEPETRPYFMLENLTDENPLRTSNSRPYFTLETARQDMPSLETREDDLKPSSSHPYFMLEQNTTTSNPSAEITTNRNNTITDTTSSTGLATGIVAITSEIVPTIQIATATSIEDDTTASNLAEKNPYFVVEKEYQELLQTRSLKPTQPRSVESVYVNPHPNCSLINPDNETVARMKKLGLVQTNQEYSTGDHDYDEVATDSSLDWSDEEEEEEEEFYDDILNCMGNIEHIYEIPPDC